jgi:hypothetical protein
MNEQLRTKSRVPHLLGVPSVLAHSRTKCDKTFVGAMSLILIGSRAKAHVFVQKKIVTWNNRHILTRTHHVPFTELVGAPPARGTATGWIKVRP